MEDATNQQRNKHLPSCLICIAQEIMVPHLMTFTTWFAVKQAFISEFGSDQKLSNQKQVFMAVKSFGSIYSSADHIHNTK